MLILILLVKMQKIVLNIIIYVLLSNYCFAQNGVVKGYYSKGKVKYEMSYANNILEGTSYWYYENGNLMSEKSYSKGKLNGWQTEYFETGLIKSEIYFNEGIRDGICKEYYENGALKEVKNYENGKLIRTIQLPYDDSFIAPVDAYKKGNRQIQRELKEERFLCMIDICPVPIGGIKSIQDKVVYPEHAKLYGLEGIVVLIATIDKEGNAIDFKVVSGLGLGCDEAAIEAVKKTRFIPGYNKGETVVADVTIKIEFRLSEKSVLTIAKRDDVLSKTDTNKTIVSTNLKNDNIYNKIDNNQNKQTINDGDSLTYYIASKITCEVTKCPIPVEGWGKILKNLIIPQTVKRLKLKGDVVVLATVDEYGNVRDTKVMQKLGHGADEAVEVAILDTHFIPGEINGQKVRCDVKITVPIR